MSARHRSSRGIGRGQALTEFALAIPLFMLVLAGVFDLGRAVYTYNGIASAAGDIARITATNTGSPIGTSAATTARIAVQRGLVPGMEAPAFACSDLFGEPLAPEDCRSGSYVEVTVSAAFQPASTLGLVPPITLRASSSVQVP